MPTTSSNIDTNFEYSLACIKDLVDRIFFLNNLLLDPSFFPPIYRRK